MKNNFTLPEAGVHALAAWFRAHAKPYFFRRKPSAYSIWILEVMTQQTQIARAEERHRKWLERFPNIQTLAEAPLESVLKEREGLGYYARARNIHRTARFVVAERGGLPKTYQELTALPGIGQYTAASIASMIHGEEVAAIDANVRRIAARLSATPLASLHDDAVRGCIKAMFCHESAAVINESLMELGEQICRRQNPLCSLCPLMPHCRGALEGKAELYTRLAAKTYYKLDFLVYCIISDKSAGKYILAEEVPAGELWAGLWRLPYLAASSAAGRNRQALAGLADLARRLGTEVVSCRALDRSVKHSHTKYRITLYPFIVAVPDSQSGQQAAPAGFAWHALDASASSEASAQRTFPSAFLKVMALL
jgi:A/G-specific adenine glycosylase